MANAEDLLLVAIIVARSTREDGYVFSESRTCLSCAWSSLFYRLFPQISGDFAELFEGSFEAVRTLLGKRAPEK